MMQMEQRQPWLDGLRCLAAFAVIVLHLSGPLLVQEHNPDNAVKHAASFSMSLVAWCVPMFVLVSGALNLASAQGMTAGAYYRKRRVWLPRTLCWVLIFAGLRFLYEPELTVSDVIRDLWHGLPYFHLWFLFMLIGLYAVTPALARLTKQTGLILAVVVLAVASWITATQPNAMNILQHNALTLFIPFIGYYWLGYALTGAPRTRGYYWAGMLLTVAGFFAIVTAPHAQESALRMLLAPPRGYMFSSFSHPVVLMSIGVFLAGRGISTCPEHRRRARGPDETKSAKEPLSYISRVAPLTFGVFVIHPIFLRLLATLPIATFLPPLAAIWLYSAIVFALSLFVAWALSRIPGVRRLIL